MIVAGQALQQQSAADGAASPPSGALPRCLDEAEFALFASFAQRREVTAGDALIRRGETGRCMYLIERGQVLLEFGGETSDKLLGPREFFGELVLFVGDHARVASATATQPGVVCVLDIDGFERVLAAAPRVVADFMRRSFAYLVASEQQLIANLRRRNEDLMLTLDSLRQTQDELGLAQHQVRTDDLTGLCNRRGLYRHLDRLPELLVGERRLGLLLIDIDEFKLVNDRHGHLVGDAVLRGVAQELSALCGYHDLPCRLGGDEFALLAVVRDHAELEARAAAVVEALRRLRLPGAAASLRLTASVGGGLCRPDRGWSVWYSDADAALYRVKSAGGNRWNVPDAAGTD